MLINAKLKPSITSLYHIDVNPKCSKILIFNNKAFENDLALNNNENKGDDSYFNNAY